MYHHFTATPNAFLYYCYYNSLYIIHVHLHIYFHYYQPLVPLDPLYIYTLASIIPLSFYTEHTV